jgi:histidinol phosphatase-like enzyme
MLKASAWNAVQFAAVPECKINLSSSWMIGDSEKDMEAGKKRRMP